MLGKDGSLRSVAWGEIFPWLNIIRTFRIAVSFRVLLLGAVGILLTLNVWAILGRVFPIPATMAAWMAPAEGCPWIAIDLAVPDQLELPVVPGAPAFEVDAQRAVRLASSDTPWQEGAPVVGVWRQLSQPVLAGFGAKVELGTVFCLFLCGLSSLAIWSFFGGAIARIVAVQLASDERVGLMAALRFACRKWLAFLAAPLIPMAGLVGAAVPVWLLGFLLRADVGILIASLFWPILLLFGLIMALLLVGVLFGWPLMWGTIATEGTDAFDAISRSYAYLFQRPLHYFFYVVVAALLGWLGWLVVQLIAAAVVGLTYWGASWGAGTENTALVMPGGAELEGVGYVGAVIIRFWATTVKLLAVGFLYGFFFAALTAVYFLLRRDVDATEMDEVWLDADTSETAPPLPPITTDVEGAPVIGEPGAATEEDDQPHVVPEDAPPADEPPSEKGPSDKGPPAP